MSFEKITFSLFFGNFNGTKDFCWNNKANKILKHEQGGKGPHQKEQTWNESNDETQVIRPWH